MSGPRSHRRRRPATGYHDPSPAGRRTVKIAPSPGRPSASMLPPWPVTTLLPQMGELQDFVHTLFGRYRADSSGRTRLGRTSMTTVNGMPAHILLVHAVVVLLPLAAFLLVLTALWEPARRRLAAANAILSIFVVIIVPMTTGAGEWLERRVPE